MKYIKQYENKDDVKYKKYILWHWFDRTENQYEILQVVSIQDDIKTYDNVNRYRTKTLYNIIDNEINFLNGVDVEEWTGRDAKKYIIFSSDNLEECINKLEIIINSKKYNI